MPRRLIPLTIGVTALAISACVTPEGGGALRAETSALRPLGSIAPATSAAPTTSTSTTLGLPESPVTDNESVCDLYSDEIEELGVVSDDAIVEASGIAASQRHPRVFWVHNDSGNGNLIHAVADDGTTRATFEIEGVLGLDWEDVAVGPGPDPETSYVYIGDIGDNLRLRPTISVLRFPEPDLTATPASIDEVTTLRFTLPTEPEDAEAMWVDPLTADVFVVTKRQLNGTAVVYRAASSSIRTTAPTPLDPIAEFRFGRGVFVTAADVTSNGGVVAWRGYEQVWMWVRTDLSYEETFAVAPCMGPSPDEIQGEALTFLAEGLSYVTLSEGSAKPLNLVSAP